MGLNKKEQEILKQIEMGLSEDDPKLEKAVENLTLSNFSRARITISFFIFLIGFITMIATYTIQPIFCHSGFCSDGTLWICICYKYQIITKC